MGAPTAAPAAAPTAPDDAGFEDEYQRAAKWVKEEMPLDAPFDASVFETIIRVVGGMLAAYELTGDQALLKR